MNTTTIINPKAKNILDRDRELKTTEKKGLNFSQYYLLIDDIE